VLSSTKYHFAFDHPHSGAELNNLIGSDITCEIIEEGANYVMRNFIILHSSANMIG
jgi:hypothetical protein